MSYAQAAKSHLDEAPPSAQPDPSLLEGTHSHAAAGEQGEVDPHGNVHVVDAREAEKLRQGIEHADEHEFHPREIKIEPSAPPAHKQHELKQAVNETETEAKQLKQDVQDKAEDVVEQGKEVAQEAAQKGKEFVKKAEQKGAQLADRAESKGKEIKREAEHEARKLGKKAEKLDKDARAAARRHPQAATGIVGAVNLAILATVGYVAYANWDKPRWDRRVVTASVVGLLAVFGAETALGLHEAAENDKETGKL